jgi:hypothetical protein
MLLSVCFTEPMVGSRIGVRVPAFTRQRQCADRAGAESAFHPLWAACRTGRSRPTLLAVTVLVAALAGCGRAQPPAAQPQGLQPLTTANSVLPDTCVVPAFPPARQVAGPAEGATTAARFSRDVAIDGTALRIAPPPADARPAVPASLAECNLRAALTAQHFLANREVHWGGLTFGLGLVTVRDDLLYGHTYLGQFTGSNDPSQDVALQPYHHRLAWVAILDPVLLSSGGGSMSARSGRPTTRPFRPSLTATDTSAYQVLILDADTGSDGLLFSSSPGLSAAAHIQPHLDGLTEQVSLPWQLVRRDPGGYSATINVPLRSCDHAGEAFLADRQQPGLVNATISRRIADCGSSVLQQAQLHATTVTSTLPATLTHAPTGAEDIYP